MVAFGRVDKTSSIAAHQLGDFYPDSYGRKFVYCKAGAAELARGLLAVAPTVVANHINLSYATIPAVGDKVIYVTLGATLATADQYKDGWLTVQDGTGQGRSYPIEGNLAADSAGTCTVYLKEAVDSVGVLAEVGVDLLAGNFNGTVISVTDQVDMPVGVPLVTVPAAYYYWSQYCGPCSVLQDSTTPAIGTEITVSAATAGAIGERDAAAEVKVGVVGQQTSVSTEYQLVNLNIGL